MVLNVEALKWLASRWSTVRFVSNIIEVGLPGSFTKCENCVGDTWPKRNCFRGVGDGIVRAIFENL